MLFFCFVRQITDSAYKILYIHRRRTIFHHGIYECLQDVYRLSQYVLPSDLTTTKMYR